MKPAAPELKKYLEKRVYLNLQGNRQVSGILSGYDIFLNIVLREASEEKAGKHIPIGNGETIVIRGNSVGTLELLEAR